MVRVLGVDIPGDKRTVIALTYIFGVGKSKSREILKATNINENKRAKELSMDEIKMIQHYVGENYKIESDLRREIMRNIKEMKDIGIYKGIRHSKKLPVRGQRTKTNSRIVRGRAKISGLSGKKKLTKK